MATSLRMSGAAQPGDIGLRATEPERTFPGKPALFLDRDGVIVEECGYLHRPEDVVLLPGVEEAIARANLLGLPVVVITNQAGIGRGLYGWEAYERVQLEITSALGLHGAHVDMVLACAYHGEGIGPYAVADHPWRKPRPGMLLCAARALGVDLPASYVVGDTLKDLEAGRAAGLRAGALTLTGHGRRQYGERGARLSQWAIAHNFQTDVAEEPSEAIHKWLDRQVR